MRYSAVLILLFIAGTCSFSQGIYPVKKLHSYKQQSLPGVRPEANEEPARNYNYYFFVEIGKSFSIRLVDLWIDGKKYSFEKDTIRTTPYYKIIQTGAILPDTISLVSRTSNKVIMFYPTGLLEDDRKRTLYIENLIRNNEMVISYIYKGKKYYVAKKKMTILPSEVHP